MSTRSESRVFVPLQTGVLPFALERAADSNPDFIYVHRNRPYMHDEDEDEEEAAPRTKSKIVECLARFKASMFSGKRSIKEVPSEEFIWQTTEDNWRPGLVTLEQAARSKAIVRRPEAFERF